MNRNLIIGISASLLFHVGLLYGGELFRPAARPQGRTVEKPTLATMVMPPIEEDPIISDDTGSDDPAKVVEFAPPMQADAPSLIIDGVFVQPIEAPPPESIHPINGITGIPQVRDYGHVSKPNQVFNPADLDQVPVPRYQTKPAYPYDMNRTGTTGVVDVGFIVTANGEVQNAYAIRSSQREFEANAVQAVLKWKFRPGKKAGRAVNTRMQVPIVFSLTQEQ